MIDRARPPATPELAEAFATVLERGGEHGLDALLAEIVRKRDGLRGFIDAVGATATGFQALFDEFDFAPDETAEDDRRRGLAAAGLSCRLIFADLRQRAEAADARTVLNNRPALCAPAFAETDPDPPAAAAGRGFPQGRWRALRSGKAVQEGAARPAARPARALSSRPSRRSSRPSDRLALFRMLEGTRCRADHRRLADRPLRAAEDAAAASSTSTI